MNQVERSKTISGVEVWNVVVDTRLDPREKYQSILAELHAEAYSRPDPVVGSCVALSAPVRLDADETSGSVLASSTRLMPISFGPSLLLCHRPAASTALPNSKSHCDQAQVIAQVCISLHECEKIGGRWVGGQKGEEENEVTVFEWYGAGSQPVVYIWHLHVVTYCRQVQEDMDMVA